MYVNISQLLRQILYQMANTFFVPIRQFSKIKFVFNLRKNYIVKVIHFSFFSDSKMRVKPMLYYNRHVFLRYFQLHHHILRMLDYKLRNY